MKKIVVKESLKESLSNLKSDLRLVKFLAPLVIIVGAYYLFLLLNHRENEGLIGVIMICLTPIACIFAAILIFMLIVFIIDTFVLIIHPCTYTFAFDELHFMFEKNGKTKLNLSHDDFKKVKYERVVDKGKEIPHLMTIVYQEHGGESDVIIDLGHFSITDQHDLLQFMADFQAAKGRTPVRKRDESTSDSERRNNIPDSGEKKKNLKIERQKRPHFIREETLALCGVALAFVTDHGKTDASAETVVRQELQGLDFADMRQLYLHWKEDMEDHLLLLKIYMAYDTSKKMYAAGFLAKVIKSRNDGGKSLLYYDAWKNVLKYVLGVSDIDSLDEAMRLFRYFEK